MTTNKPLIALETIAREVAERRTYGEQAGMKHDHPTMVWLDDVGNICRDAISSLQTKPVVDIATWNETRLVVSILQKLDPVKYREIDWADLHGKVEEYHKEQEAK